MTSVEKTGMNTGLRKLPADAVLTAAAVAGLICLLVYLRTLSGGFVNIDDPYYVENNPLIKSLDMRTLFAILTESRIAAWIPLTYLSFAVDYHFWGLNPAGYHLTNSLLHMANTVMVVMLVERLFWRLDSAVGKIRDDRYLFPGMLLLTGLLFGLHPLRVESVAWVSERKDVLNGLFFLASVHFYLGYVRKRMLLGGKGAGRDYSISIALFLFSLLAKQVSVVMPMLLLVIDWFPLRRMEEEHVVTLLLEKLPYLVLSLAVTFFTIYLASGSNMLISAEEFPFYARCLVSGNAIFEYCRYLLYPVGIVPYFVMGDTIQGSFIVKTAVVVLFTCYCAAKLRKRPALSATWFSFVLLLLPVLAFTQAADDTSIASRYTYLPSIPVSICAAILLASGCCAVFRGRLAPARGALAVIVIALSLGYGAMTWRLIAVWKNSGTLWTRQIELQPMGRAYALRGRFHYSAGNLQGALADFSRAILIAEQEGREDVFNLYAYRGETFRVLGLHGEALRDFTAAIHISPHPLYYYYRGLVYSELGSSAEANEDFRRAGNYSGPIPWFYKKHE